MKKILMVFAILFCSTILKSQVSDTTRPTTPLQFDYNLLFSKARKQKTTAWVLLGAGSGVALAGFIIAANGAFEELFGFSSGKSVTGSVMMLAGAASIVASIPFFISSGKNQKKATLMLQKSSHAYSGQALNRHQSFSVGVKIGL